VRVKTVITGTMVGYDRLIRSFHADADGQFFSAIRTVKDSEKASVVFDFLISGSP